MGCVYRVRERDSGRISALKVLPRELAADPAFVERFEREARTLARLRLVGDALPSPTDLARELGLTEGALKVAVHRLRRRFREAVRAEISQTLTDGDDVQEELRYLIEVLASPQPGLTQRFLTGFLPRQAHIRGAFQLQPPGGPTQ
jgi:serine/threonine protein kinase